MQMVFNFLLRVVLMVAGLLFGASLLVVMVLLMAVWGVRAAWARLTGQAFSPFGMRLDPRTGFQYVYRRRSSSGGQRASTSAATGSNLRRRLADVTDVEPKAPRPQQS